MANPRETRIDPATGRRYGWVDPDAPKIDPEAAAIQGRIDLLKRQQIILEARERFMPFIKFTSPDPEDPNDVTRSRYKNARHHDALARVVEEVVKGEIRFLILTMPPRHGKEIADSEEILTPDGWRTHGALRVGDYVFGLDGAPARVLAVSPKTTEKLKITFSDGSTIRCHPNHQWTVYDRARGKLRVLETRAMLQQAYKSGARSRFQLPHAYGVAFGKRHLPLDPYTLGVWLGDGAVGAGRIDMAASDEAVWRRIEQSGMPISSIGTHPDTGVKRVYFGNGKPGARGPLTRALHDLGVLERKAIPEIYLRSSREQRLEILAGLMDTDGHVERATGRCRIVTTELALCDGIVDLCTTLGFRPYVTKQEAAVSSSGICGRKPVYTVGFQPFEALPTSLERRRVTRFAVRRRIGIVNIERCVDEPGHCIQVDREDGLYLVGRALLPTHNSEQVSRRLPAWFMGKFPHQNVVVATYNDDFAMDFGKEVRTIIQSKPYQQVFPDLKLKRGGTASDRLQTAQGGQASFVGRGGSLTGRGAHLLIIDDLIKDDKEAQSQAIRDQAWNWFTKVAMSRRMGKKLVVMTFTRWHSDDPIGRLTDPENPNYNAKLARRIKIINLPAIAEEDDPLGRTPGEALWPDGPDQFDLDFLEEQRSLDPLGFAALYQQRPSLLDGDLFKREDIRFYGHGTGNELPENLRFYAASDHAVGTKQRNDLSCLLLFGVGAQDDIYLIDCIWKRMKSDMAVEAMLTLAGGNMRPLIWWAEKGHISQSIGPFLYKRMAETQNYINIREVTPVGDKAQRAQSIAARVAMGKLFFPKDALWTEKAINEMMAFPNGTHDDFVDTLSLVGLGLRSQFGASVPKPETKRPAFGTLAWVKEADTWSDMQRARREAGGF